MKSKKLYIGISIFIVIIVVGGTMVSVYWQDISESYRLYQFGIKKWQLPTVEGGPKVPAKAIYIVLKDEKTLIINGTEVALSDFSQHLSSIAPESVRPIGSREATIVVFVRPGQTVREFRPLYEEFLIERCGDIRFLASSQNGMVAVPLPVIAPLWLEVQSVPNSFSAWVVKLSGEAVSLTNNYYDTSAKKEHLHIQEGFVPRRISLNDLKTMLKEESGEMDEEVQDALMMETILFALVEPDCEFGLLLKFLSLAHQFKRKKTIIVDIPAFDIDSKSQEKKEK